MVSKNRFNISLDIIASFFVLVFGLALIIISFAAKDTLSPIGTVIFLSSLAYLILRGRLSQEHHSPSLEANNSLRKLNQVIFIVSLCTSIWLLHDSLYFRPLPYFMLTLIAAASIIWEIFYSGDSKSTQAFILGKVIALGFIFRAGIYYEFSGIYGVDPWFHNFVVQQTVSSSHVVDYINAAVLTPNIYDIFPTFHISGAMTQIVTSLSTYNSIFATVGFLGALSCVFVFLIGRKLASVKAGLLAALIFCLCDGAILWSTHIIAMSLSIGFVAMLLYLIFVKESRDVASIFLMLIISAVLILTHTVAPFTMAIMLIGIIIGISFYKGLDKKSAEYREILSIFFVTLFVVCLISWWMLLPVTGTSPFFDQMVQRFNMAISYDAEFALMKPAAEAYAPYFVEIFNNGGYLLLLGLGVIGSLIYLHPQSRSQHRLALVSTIASLILFANLFVLARVGWSVVVGRWAVFEYMILSILAVVGLVGLSNIIGNNRGRFIMVLLVILLVLFPMITNDQSNNDSPVFRYNIYRTGYSESELAAVSTLSGILSSEPVADAYFSYALVFMIDHDEYEDMLSGGSRALIVRRYDLHDPDYNERYKTRIRRISWEYLFEGREIVVSDYVRELETDKQALIYSNNNLWVWQMP